MLKKLISLFRPPLRISRDGNLVRIDGELYSSGDAYNYLRRYMPEATARAAVTGAMTGSGPNHRDLLVKLLRHMGPLGEKPAPGFTQAEWVDLKVLEGKGVGG